MVLLESNVVDTGHCAVRVKNCTNSFTLSRPVENGAGRTGSESDV